MIYLLDVSLLIALLDESHVHHRVALRWFARLGPDQRATCPITENGLLRILTSSGYPRILGSPAEVFEVFRELCARDDHHFWPDDFTFLDVTFRPAQTSIPSSHITDLYLLSLALRRGGKFASFDRRIPAHLLRQGTDGLHLLTA